MARFKLWSFAYKQKFTFWIRVQKLARFSSLCVGLSFWHHHCKERLFFDLGPTWFAFIARKMTSTEEKQKKTFWRWDEMKSFVTTSRRNSSSGTMLAEQLSISFATSFYNIKFKMWTLLETQGRMRKSLSVSKTEGQKIWIVQTSSRTKIQGKKAKLNKIVRLNT